MIEFNGDKLKKIIKNKGFTLTALSKNIGYHRTTINNWIKGNNTPSKENIIKICDFLNIEASTVSNIKTDATLNESLLDINNLISERNRRKHLLLDEFKKDDLVINKLKRALKCITSSINIAFAVKSLDLKYVYINDPFLSLTHCDKKSEVIGKRDKDIFNNTDLSQLKITDTEILINEQPILKKEIYTPNSRKKRFSSLSKFPVFDEDGKLTGITVMIEDITELKATKQLLELKITALNFFENTAFLVKNLTTNEVLEADENLTKLTGFTKEDVQNGLIGDFNRIHPEDEKIIRPLWEKLFNSGKPNNKLTYRIYKKNGELITVQETFCKIIQNKNEIYVASWQEVDQS